MKSTLRICPQCGTETSASTCRRDGFGTVDYERYRKLDPTALIGTLFQDRYRVEEVLGSGGMGTVYRATQVRVGRQVALKVIHTALSWDLDVVARFQREGRAVAGLIHPNIVQVYDFGQSEEGQLFMAMELVAGPTLAELIADEAPLEPSRVIHLGVQMLDALAEAHEHGIVHRDLTPHNVFLTATGRRRDVIKIVDFGIAKMVNEPKTDSMVTSRGAIVGSPRYMAPEQARGKGVTGHADIYAVGGILYEMLSGAPVFDEPSPADYLVAHSVKMPSPPMVDDQPLRGPLVDVVLQCLEKKPWNRPDGATRALEMLEACRLAPLVGPGDHPPVHVAVTPPAGDGPPRRLVPQGDRAPALVSAQVAAEVVPPPLPEPSTVAPMPTGRPLGAPAALDLGARPRAAGGHRDRSGARVPAETQPEPRTKTATDEITAIPLIVRRQSDPTLDFEPPEAQATAPAHAVFPTAEADEASVDEIAVRGRRASGWVWLLAAAALIGVGVFMWSTTQTAGVAATDPGGPAQPSAARATAPLGPSPGGEVGPAEAARPDDEGAPGASASSSAHAAVTLDPLSVPHDGAAPAHGVASEATAEAAPSGVEAAPTAAGDGAPGRPSAAGEASGDGPDEAAATRAAHADEHASATEPPRPSGERAAQAASADPTTSDRREASTPRPPKRQAQPAGTPSSRTAALTADRPGADRSTPPSSAASEREAAPSADAVEEVTLESRPGRASVYTGEHFLGKTPIKLQRRAGDPPLAVELRRDGYEVYALTLPPKGAVRVVLDPAPDGGAAGER